ncbi:gluconate permease [Paenibacillus glucanolyticus]|jgi:GntP family gluconate:H+ symporter|uniref:Gluconate permease n=2 Tax=Paenibacillus TaxID=44249 RepID=A0A162EM78_9BACL|nr:MULTISPECIES: gluconate:H+ symporter [Paenibacillus]ANA81557.1 gluconate permease [Paenibacillus glucanolyticus]AVV59712.1 gluconate permease [Paenibacillus glucanolyticus]AWP28967.1 gluconate permease [Paenibacillus sp. Cedars]ETT30409.1 gluconate transporter [Paenibacillus sp. FSL R5-808]KZS47601.1 gluconate permease [Paenibacillus glucanolyticus]
MLTGPMLIVVFLIALAFLFLLIIKWKVEPFLALTVIAFGTAIAIGIPLKEVPGIVTSGFGNTLVGVGILIGLGVIFGQFLGASGAVEKIAGSLLKIFGIKNSPAGLAMSGTLVSIPVFFDAAFVILSGLLKSLATRTGISIVTFVTALGIGLITSHNMIAPTPGPMVVAENTGADLGLFILYGILVAIPATLVGGFIYGMFIGKRIQTTEEVVVAEEAENKAPRKEISTSLSFGMLALPIVLILANTISKMLYPGTAIETFFGFIGDKNIALLISVFAAVIFLRPYIAEDSGKLYSEAIATGGMIVLITGAGGAFGAVINHSGIGDYLITTMQSWSIPVLMLAFIFSQILRASLGSSTVALVTTSSIMGPLVLDLGVSPILLGLAICAGGIGLSLPNDSGFWVVNRFGKLTVTQTLKVWTLGGFIAGLTALASVYVLSLFSGILPGL